MTIPEKAVEWALSVASDNSHGYDQGNRWGPDYDCSSLVISAYKHAGLPLQSTYTRNMKPDFLQNGFKDVSSEVNFNTGAGFILGDVLLNITHHTAMYVGGGRVVEAGGNEFGGITGGQTGDQTGHEIAINPYHNYGRIGWDCCLRYEGENAETPATDGGDETYTVKQGDTLWCIANAHGMSYQELAAINGLDPNTYIYPGQVLRLKAQKPAPDPVEDKPADDVYIVKAGDSLWQIAQHTLGKGWRWYRIAEANNLAAPYIIHPGQRLKIPSEL